MTVQGFFRKFWWAVLGVVIVFFVMLYLIVSNGVTNDGNKKQEDLIAFYNETTNVLSDCLVKTKSAVGVAGAQTDALDRVITNAVKGRYTEGSTAQPGNSNALFSALSEAYPDTSGLSRTFENVQIIITGCRTNFRDSQSELQKAVTRFNQWRKGSFTVRTFGGGNYPNDDLAIRVDRRMITGQEALNQMRTLVVVSDAQTGRDSGVIRNDDPFAPDQQ